MSYEMYEDFKETMVKTIKTELAAKTANNNQSSDNDLSQRLEQIVYTEQERHQAIIIQLAGRLESIEQNYIEQAGKGKYQCFKTKRYVLIQ